MPNLVKKADFKEMYGYSESTYHRRMNKFRVPQYRGGYIANTPQEVSIDIEIYEQFRRDESDKRLHYQKLG